MSKWILLPKQMKYLWEFFSQQRQTKGIHTHTHTCSRTNISCSLSLQLMSQSSGPLPFHLYPEHHNDDEGNQDHRGNCAANHCVHSCFQPVEVLILFTQWPLSCVDWKWKKSTEHLSSDRERHSQRRQQRKHEGVGECLGSVTHKSDW